MDDCSSFIINFLLNIINKCSTIKKNIIQYNSVLLGSREKLHFAATCDLLTHVKIGDEIVTVHHKP